jgi:3-oxo-5alpha-steroid 4-dehydrogenase
MSESADVIIVGMGGAGACAALEARAGGASVVVLERFNGGGATAISGGVVYAGGTHIQDEAGVEDDAEQMFAYLRQEVQGVISDEMLRRFCDESAGNLRWLADHGVPFEASLCPVKTSYPSDDYYLYYSGNEGFAPYRDHARPAPRGHRAKGTGLPGRSFYAPLEASALAAGAEVRRHARVDALLQDDDGRVVGVRYRQLAGFHAWLHGAYERWAIKVVNYNPKVARSFRRRAAALEKKHGVDREIRAARGVILAAGGFIYNREMVKAHAPDYRKGMPLGTAGCAGLGIQLGQSVGGAVDQMNRVSAWRFLNPPPAFTEGLLLNGEGRRYVNESLYGAAVGEAMVDGNDGVGLLVIDEALKAKARTQVGKGQTQWFQTAPALLNLWFNCRKAETVGALAKILRADPDVVQQTLDRYHEDEEDAFGKAQRARLSPPYYVLNCGIRSKRWPLPTLTLGGLVVDEETGQVRREDGSGIAGLYAAGRTAVGVCSRQYVSGLSIADCVFSGRRAGRAAAAV